MSGLTPTRSEISDRFSVLGFRVQTGRNPYFEVAIASDPVLFRPENKPRRTPSNFYSTRNGSPMVAERGTAVYLVPPNILRRMVGNERLYYVLATFPDSSRSNAEVWQVPPEVMSPVRLSKSFTGKELRKLIGVPNRRGSLAKNGDGYGSVSPDSMTWAGDEVIAGKTEVVTPKNGGGASVSSAAPKEVKTTLAGQSSAALAEYDVPYSDGLDDSFWSQQQEASEDDHGIEGPMPDSLGLAQSQAISRALDAPEYPQASRFEPAASVNYRTWTTSTPRVINRVVIHITDGGNSINGTIGWFQNPNQKGAPTPTYPDGKPITVSAHYVVGQDGEVVQMVHNADVAWHASAANGDSIGIEHVARPRHGTKPALLPSQAEYCASAALVSWLCSQYGIPVDRDHILGHSEASPRDHHDDCPNSVWDWNYFMGLVGSNSCYPLPAASSEQSLGGGQTQTMRASRAFSDQSFDTSWGNVELVPQLTCLSCWAAAASMVVGWRERISINPTEIASGAGQWAAYAQGLNPADVPSLARAWGLVMEPPQSYTVDGLHSLLQTGGPLWVSAYVPGLHAIVVTGIYGDGTPDSTYVRINDPWGSAQGSSPGGTRSYNPTPGQGSQYTLTLRQFASEYEGAANLPSVNIQILHTRPDQVGDRSPTTAAQSLAMAASLAVTSSSGRQGASSKSKKNGMPAEGAFQVPPTVVPAVATIAGTVLTRILNNEGDIHWDLAQMQGLKYPLGDTAKAGSAAYQTNRTPVKGAWIENLLGDRISADFEIVWQHNGHALGNIGISNTATNDAVGWSLKVMANINDDANGYTRPPSTELFAAVRVRFSYNFARSIGADQILIQDFTLYGDGNLDQEERWTQE